MKSLFSVTDSKEQALQMKMQGMNDIEILTEMHIRYIKRFIGIRQLKASARAIRWKALPRTEQIALDGVYSMGFRAPKDIAQRLSNSNKCIITIETNMNAEDESPFEEN